MIKTLDYDSILKLPIDTWDEPATVGSYLGDTLVTFVQEGEGFSGKRPFGDSDWEYHIARPLVEAKVISGTITIDPEYPDDTPDIDWDYQELENKLIELVNYIFESYQREV